jgi:hypothetical protein
MISDKDLYTQIRPEEVWQVYRDVEAIFKGGGSSTSAKMHGQQGIRAKDFTIIYDPLEQMEMVCPDRTKGLSFSDSIDRLKHLPIRGVVWRLPKGRMLPKGLVINYQTRDHPLINVEYRMSVMDLMVKLKQLADLMERTEVTIK